MTAICLIISTRYLLILILIAEDEIYYEPLQLIPMNDVKHLFLINTLPRFMLP